MGFVHSVQFGKPSLVCGFKELYRYFIDDYIIKHYLKLSKRDFALKAEDYSSKKKGKREYLKNDATNLFIKGINKHFEDIVEIPRIRVGARQQIETLICEESLILAKYLRGERATWIPRIAELK